MIGILGVGNILLKDEGFGVKFVHVFRSKYSFPENVEVVDGGTAGMFLSSIIEKYRKLLIIDVVNEDLPAGTVKVYEKEDFFLNRIPTKLSHHQLGLQEVLLLSEIMGKCPEEIKLIGVVPKEIEVGTELTPELEKKLEEVEKLALKILENWGVKYSIRRNSKPEVWWERKRF